MEHANGAKSVIAKAVSGGSETPSDYWYEAAQEVLDALAEEGLRHPIDRANHYLTEERRHGE